MVTAIATRGQLSATTASPVADSINDVMTSISYDDYSDSLAGAAGVSQDEVNLKMLMNAVPGTPGEDYPIYAEAPATDFDCGDKKFGGKFYEKV